MGETTNTAPEAAQEQKAGKIDTTVRIGGREIKLIYNMRIQEAIEIEMNTDYYTLLDRINKGKRNTKETVDALRLMGNEGLRMAGQEPDLTEDWLLDRMSPGEMIGYRTAVVGAMINGYFMETDNSYEEEQDVTLNEIRKKNGSTESPTGE